MKGQNVELRFSRQDPTIARIAWRAFQLPEGYEHLDVTLESVCRGRNDPKPGLASPDLTDTADLSMLALGCIEADFASK